MEASSPIACGSRLIPQARPLECPASRKKPMALAVGPTHSPQLRDEKKTADRGLSFAPYTHSDKGLGPIPAMLHSKQLLVGWPGDRQQKYRWRDRFDVMLDRSANSQKTHGL